MKRPRSAGLSTLLLSLTVVVVVAGSLFQFAFPVSPKPDKQIAFSPQPSKLGNAAPSLDLLEKDGYREENFLAVMAPRHVTRIREFIPNIEQQCLMLGYQIQKPRTSAQHELERLLNRVRRSAVGSWLLKQASWRATLICLDANTMYEGYFRSHMRLIGLRSGSDDAKRLSFLVHELAHVPQHPRYSNNRLFPIDDMIRIQRFREAAAEATATRILAELRALGDGAPWQAKLHTRYHDILKAYDHELTKFGDMPDADLRATRAAFQQWFRAPWRIAFYDGLMLDHIEKISRDRIGLIPTKRNAKGRYLAEIAQLPHTYYLDPGTFDPQHMPYNVPMTTANYGRMMSILFTQTNRSLDGPIP